jgi:hypothetical protein
MSKTRLLSGKIKKKSGVKLDGTRYEYLDVSQAEPDLGLPSTTGSVLISLTTGTRIWSPLLTVTDFVKVASTTQSLSTDTGALVVTGGLGVGGDVWIGGTIHGGNLSGTAAASTTATNLIGGGPGQIPFQTASGVTGFSSNLTYNSSTGVLSVFNTTESTSTTTGALVISGGVGIGGNLYIAGEIVAQKLTIEYTTVTTTYVVTDDVITTTNPTQSTSTYTGALIVTGGVGIGGNTYIGGDLNVGGSLVITTASIAVYAPKTIITAGTDTEVSTSTGEISIWNISTLQSVTGRGNSTTNGISIIGEFGENSNTSTFNSVLSFDSSYSDIARGPNKIKLFDESVWQAGFGISQENLDIYSGYNTNFYQGTTADNIGHLALSINSSSVVISITSASISTNTGALQVTGGVGIGGDVNIGGAIYVNTEAYIGGALAVTSASLANYFVAGDDISITNNYDDLIIISNTSTLASITQRGSYTYQPIAINNTGSTISTDSGALTVAGGVGIGGDLYLGGDAILNTVRSAASGDLYIKTGSANTWTFGANGTVSIPPVVWNYIPTTYTSIPVTYGATQLTFTVKPDNTITNMSVAVGAGGYGPGSVNLTISGTIFPGGTSPANDIVFNIETFESPGPVNSTAVNSAISYVSGTPPQRYDNIYSTGNVGIGASNKHWVFGTDGKTSLASGVEISNADTFNFLSWNTGTALIIADVPYDAGSFIYIPSSSDTSGALGIVNTNTSGSIMLTQGNGNTTNQLYVNNSGTTINNIFGGISKTWTFSTDGVLTNPGKVIIQSDEDSSSTTTGALQVVGGAGIGQNLYVKGSITAEGGFVGLNATSIYQNTSSVTVNDPGYEGQVSIIVADNTNTIFFANSTTFVKPSYFSDTTQLWHPPTTGTIYTTASVVIAGGAAVFGDLWVDKTLYSRGLEVITTATLGGLGVGVLYAGTDTVVDYHTGIVTIWNQSTLQSISNRGATTTNAISITNETVAESTETGALIVTGGVGIGGNAYIGGDLNVGGSLVITTASIASYAPKTVITAGTDTEVSTSTGEISVWNISTLQSVSDRGSTTSNVIHISNATSSTTSTDGAFIVDGGIGVAGDIRVGGNVYSQGGQPLYTPSVTLSPTPPAEPRIGDFWYDSNSFSYQYILDGTSTFWIQVGSTV